MEMNQSPQRSAYKRKPRSDTGKPHKWAITPEYAFHISRCSQTGERILREPELLLLLGQGCQLCGVEATRVRAGKPYCPQCDRYVGIGGEVALLVWMRRVAPYRL